MAIYPVDKTMTVEEVRENKNLQYSHTASRKGYESRRGNGHVEKYNKESEKAANNESTEEAHNGYILREKSEIGRIQLVFDGKPDADTRALLKSNGFRWAPSEGAWQRMLNDNGRRAARTVIEKLEADA